MRCFRIQGGQNRHAALHAWARRRNGFAHATRVQGAVPTLHRCQQKTLDPQACMGLWSRPRSAAALRRVRYGVNQHELLPRQRPGARRRAGSRRDRSHDRAPQRRRRPLRGPPRAASCRSAHGRSIHLLRSFRAGGVSRRPGHRRAAASSYRPRDRYISVRRRDHAPRQSRHQCGDPPRRGQLDERRPRHRAFRAHGSRSPARRRADPWSAVLGRAAGGGRGKRSELFPSRQRIAAAGEWRGQDDTVGSGQRLR